MKSNKIIMKEKKQSSSENIFTVFSYIIMTVLGLICILPCLHVVSK